MPERTLNAREASAVAALNALDLKFALLYLTPTGLGKSIMDATEPVRSLLKSSGLHDYDDQLQGQAAKRIVPAVVVSGSRVGETQASLYRPETKSGDPRLWVYELGQFALAGDVLAVAASRESLLVVNLSAFSDDLGGQEKLQRIVRDFTGQRLVVAEELLSKLREIAALGPVAAVGYGDTAVGRTLETLLGIQMNSNRAPDYNGIELKSGRPTAANRSSLFAQVPDRTLSRVTLADMLAAYGYWRDGDLKLYHTISATRPNSLGLQFRVDLSEARLIEFHVRDGDLLVWRIELLQERLRTKHRETFWISAETSQGTDGNEMFRFYEVEHTKEPNVAIFPELVTSGVITMDHLLKLRSGHAHEKGPLFKMKRSDFPLLFPPSKSYRLE